MVERLFLAVLLQALQELEKVVNPLAPDGVGGRKVGKKSSLTA